MKKIIACVLIAVLLLASAMYCFADSENIVWEYENAQKTVVFSGDTSYTEEEQKYIADMLVFGESEDDGIETYSLCWLTGHTKKTEIVSVITHKVRTSVPRCLKQKYEVTTCEKCTYQEETLISQTYVACCPAD